ncbi:hypothetical protein LX32DRAFT_697132 [Colletotrichum zoysiae]|uniref:F-box domain-containing protein n=1 Tax=Colletotrichum zoysiae TaxID=1216348 RepID=A0AAD9H9X7_9PEZI|nr:hypothetical protein LX32DRAFT_697132 [Colletotrichum zoysiae]
MADTSSSVPDVLQWEWDQEDVDRADSPSLAKTIDDMRRLLNNPAHISAIRHVTLRGVRAAQHFESDHLTRRLAEEDKAALKSWVVDAKLPLATPAVPEHDGDILMTDATAALLSRLPALKTLDIETFDRTDDDEWTGSRPPGDPFMASLNQLILSARGGPAFQAIETAKVLVPVPDDEPENEFDFYVYAGTVLPLFHLPRIRTVELHRVDDGRKPLSWPGPDVPRATALTELALIKSQISGENAGRIIRVCPNLRTLRYEHVVDAEHASAWLDLGRVRDSLAALEGSLEDLTLAVTLWASTAVDCGEAGPWGIRGSLGSLRGFARLARLTVSLPALLGWRTEDSAKLADVLPEGLQSLTITDEMYFWWRYQWDDLDWDRRKQVAPRWRSIEAKVVEYLESRPRSLKELKLEISVAGEGGRAEQLKAGLVSKGEARGGEGLRALDKFNPA